ncbi:hypothetical protein OsI_11670 [Oryza sativa Indica Group]|uniref:Uncharacterized protein n=1 Tax=Oryza sativa subsp. indica TaxID=39946 RepID=B8APW6_ORYSI|nr:hypothetical protein OsI_11670 [Oryza sativa Indica Group]
MTCSSHLMSPHIARSTIGRRNDRGGGGGGREPPEKRLTLFALRLAVLEKAASGLGKLDFVWATVVLLGGFASALSTTDFWCVTVILVGSGARVFGRSHELEWQHRSTLTSSTAGGALRSTSRRLLRSLGHSPAANPTDDGGARGSATETQFQHQIVARTKQRVWHVPDVSLLPYTGRLFVSKNIGRLFSWLQVLSALACVALSVMRLWRHDFGGDQPNKRPALLLFYTLALIEALIFLLEQAYWVWMFSRQNLIKTVSDDCKLGEYYGPDSLKRFFFDAYSRCITGSIFDGTKMDLVTFAEELILSEFLGNQLIGVRILQQFTTEGSSANAGESNLNTLRNVGTNARSIERLVEMINWKSPGEEEVRRCAAEVLSKLADKSRNALRVSGIPGAIESVMSLLYTDESAPDSAAPHDGPRLAGEGQPLPKWTDADVDEFIASDPVYSPQLNAMRESRKSALGGALVGGAHLGGICVKYAKGPHDIITSRLSNQLAVLCCARALLVPDWLTRCLILCYAASPVDEAAVLCVRRGGEVGVRRRRHDEEKNALQTAVAYNAEADAWVPLPDMATERDEARGLYVGGVFVVVGGGGDGARLGSHDGAASVVHALLLAAASTMYGVGGGGGFNAPSTAFARRLQPGG